MSRLILTMAALGALGACSAAALPTAEAPAAPSALASAAAPAALTAPASAPELAGGPLAETAAAPLVAEAPTRVALAEAVRCDIRTRRTARGVELEARARANAPAFGEYEFVITKHDRGGSSDIVQGGAFDLAAGQSQSLGLSEISVERGGRYRARLVLSDSDGVICREEVRS